MNVVWLTCGSAGSPNWCPLESLDLGSVTDVGGVYIIWHEGSLYSAPRVVKVGQAGSVKARLSSHRNDNEITYYRKFGTLRVTWASVQVGQRDGVERFLGDTLKPLVGSLFPVATPIAVNYPW